MVAKESATGQSATGQSATGQSAAGAQQWGLTSMPKPHYPETDDQPGCNDPDASNDSNARSSLIASNDQRCPSALSSEQQLSGQQFDVSWILPNLAMGARLGPAEAQYLSRSCGVRCVVEICEEAPNEERFLSEHGFRFLRLSAPDCCAIEVQGIALGVAWVQQQHSLGEKVYVHCFHGIGRSALLACCVLVANGYTAKTALALVKERRPKVSPSQEQLQALLDWSNYWHRHSPAENQENLEELCRIAYRHLQSTS